MKKIPPVPPPPPEEFALAAVAVQLSCSKPTVKRIAQRLNLGRKIGNMRLVTADDVERIRAELKPGPGNPGFGTVFKGPPPKETKAE